MSRCRKERPGNTKEYCVKLDWCIKARSTLANCLINTVGACTVRGTE